MCSTEGVFECHDGDDLHTSNNVQFTFDDRALLVDERPEQVAVVAPESGALRYRIGTTRGMHEVSSSLPRMLVDSNGGPVLYDLDTGAVMRLDLPEQAPLAAEPAHEPGFTPDGTHLLVGSRIFDARDGRVVTDLDDNDAKFTQIRISPDGNYVAGEIGFSHVIVIYDVRHDARVRIDREPGRHNLIGFSRDSQLLLEGWDELRVWRLTNLSEPLARVHATADDRGRLTAHRLLAGLPMTRERLLLYDSARLANIPFSIDELRTQLRASRHCLSFRDRQQWLEESSAVATLQSAACAILLRSSGN